MDELSYSTPSILNREPWSEYVIVLCLMNPVSTGMFPSRDSLGIVKSTVFSRPPARASTSYIQIDAVPITRQQTRGGKTCRTDTDQGNRRGLGRHEDRTIGEEEKM